MYKFFLGGNIPNNVNDAQRFLQNLNDSGEEGMAGLAKEIDQFYPDQLEEFLENVLPLTWDERILGLVYFNKRAVDMMKMKLSMKYFKFIHERSLKDQIDPVFYESCAASLIRGYDTKNWRLNLLPELSTVVIGSRSNPNAFHTFPGSEFDKAMAAHLSEVLSFGHSERAFTECKKSLWKVELPISLGVLLQDRVNAGATETAAKLVSELFILNKLTDKYIPVCREVLGDGLFLQACTPAISQGEGIRSVSKLAPIFGEETFHSPSFFQSVRWNNDGGELPGYLDSFRKMGFDEAKLPLLAGYLMDNLKRATRTGYAAKGLDFIKDIANLGVRLGRGSEVLSALVTNLREVTNRDDKSTVAPAAQINELFRLKSESSMATSKIRAFLYLLDVIEIVGLEALYELAPTVDGKVIGEFLSRNKTDLSERQIMSMFPQSKGHMLDQALGL
jgi:hypothetical protein